jgi:NAD(P)-dependent dehydrogenase (short-subunit alcohol dehydrogenase family)
MPFFNVRAADIVVNNAGIATAIPELTSIEEAKRQFDVNLFGAFRAVPGRAPSMRRQGSGYIRTLLHWLHAIL